MAQNLDLNKLLPNALKNPTLTSLVSNLFNRFVSEEQSVSIAGRIGTKDPLVDEADIQATDLDHELNALIPALYMRTGVEEFVTTFDDIVNKLKALNVDVDSMKEWMAEQSFNFAPPIDLDKFINFSNYFWVGHMTATQSTKDRAVWNNVLDPEYYVIKRPPFASIEKFPARLVTSNNIKLHGGGRLATGDFETFTITFSNAVTFSIASNEEPVLAKRTQDVSFTNGPFTISPFPEEEQEFEVATTGSEPLFNFFITTGTAPFQNGDSFTIEVKYFTSEIYVSFTPVFGSPLNKGPIDRVVSSLEFMSIDGQQVQVNDRVLVKDQTLPSENGIYIVSTGHWSRAADAIDLSYMPAGSKVFINEGNTQTGYTYQLAPDLVTFALSSTTDVNFINTWQEFNFWYHRDDVAALGLSIDNLIQAVRPIIEYDSNLQLNAFVLDGIPAETGTENVQQKTRFNQIPLFDLFRYDSTHAGKTSGIFFYSEDQDYPIDSILQRRVKTTSNADFIFGFGITDEDNRLLFYKNPDIRTIWTAGVSSPSIGTPTINNVLDAAAVTFSDLKSDMENEQWTLVANNSNEFAVTGSRHGAYQTLASPGIPYETDDFTFTIALGTYNEDDIIKFFTRNKVSPRYVEKLEDESIANYPKGPSGEPGPENDRLDNGFETGTWLTPLRMFQNLEREIMPEVIFGDLINHFRSIIKNQDGIVGASFGNNNFRDLDINLGYGGSIREFESNFPLLLSMMLQRDISPLGVLDFAERQYAIALSSADQIIVNELARFIGESTAIPVIGIDANNEGVQALLSELERIRGLDENLKNTFSDSSAKIKNWPVTLPIIGAMPATQPSVEIDNELNAVSIVHHDGHKSPIALDDIDFSSAVVRTKVVRSDGTESSGIFKNSAPVPPANIPYARQLWMEISSKQLYVFDVKFDTDVSPMNGSTGDYWFDRSTQVLYEWDSIGTSWIISADSIASIWVPFSIAAIRNSLVLAIEQRLYDSVHSEQSVLIDLYESEENDPHLIQQMQVELARYAAKFGYDLFGGDFNNADAFTWNYSQATIAGVPASTARWHEIYKAYFDQPGSTLSTSRPDLEPWRLFNFATKPTGFDTAYANTVVANEALRIPNVRVIAESPIVSLSGLQTIDGVTLAVGDRVLLIAQPNPVFNGVYVVATGPWAGAPDTLQNGTTITASEGIFRATTTWVLTTADPVIVGVDALTFAQSRVWSDAMWLDIKTTNPGLKLCVNPFTDELLPPYVSTTDPVGSVEALLTAIPTGISNSYVYGDRGPVELLWTKSLEYPFSLARTLFKKNPLKFLDTLWGETYVNATTNGIRVERNLANSLPHLKFQLHGDVLHNIRSIDNVEDHLSSTLSTTWSGAEKAEFEVTFVSDNYTYFKVLVDGAEVGSIEEGVLLVSPIITLGLSIDGTIDDLGIPFNLGDKFIISYSSVGVPTFSFVAAKSKRLVGLGQLFTNALRFSLIDTGYSFAANAFNAWDVRLAHRLGALIRQDNLNVNTSLGNLPDTAYSLLLKKSSNVDSRWISAIRIQLVEMGQAKLNQFGLRVPRTDGSDWTFRIEVYNPQNPAIDYYEFDTGGPFQTFFALSKESTDLEWKRFTTVTTLIKDSPMPKTVTGVQNVLNILYGYITRLEELGFFVNFNEDVTIDEETGRNLNWQLEVEKFVDRVFRGMSTGEGHILNPFMKSLWLSTPVGIMSRYTQDSTSDMFFTQSVYDVLGVTIPLNQLEIVRNDAHAVTISGTPIFSGHLFTDEYEHVILFNDKISDEAESSSLFVPFLGLALPSAYMTYVRNQDTTRKPTFNGFFLSSNGVKRNITSSIDQIGKYYDASRSFDDPDTARHAMSLLGFSKKDYFKDINVTDSSQFNFWRGLIQAKGTNLSLDAFVNYRKFLDAGVDEYWAYKLAEYGDARERTQPEIKINTRDVTQRFTQLQFYSSTDGLNQIPLFTAIEASDDTRWFSIDDLGASLKFEAESISEDVVATQVGYYRLTNIYHNANIQPTITPSTGAAMVSASVLNVTVPGTYTISGYTWKNPTKFSPVKLFDYKDQILVKEIGLWHPAIGIHNNEPLEVVDVINSFDPALYNTTVKVTDNPNYHTLKPWAKREVGRVWWDTSKLGYVPYYDATVFPNMQDRQELWGNLAEWAQIKVYEWVESSVPPHEYDALAEEEAGRADIPAEIRASGSAAKKEFYQRDRVVEVRPVAWSQAAVGNPNAHPSFGSSEQTKVFIDGGAVYPNAGSTEQVHLLDGRRFGAWDVLNEKPIGEVVISDEVEYRIGSTNSLNGPSVGDGINFTASIQGMGSGLFGVRMGAVSLTSKDVDTDKFLRMSDSDGNYQDVLIENDWVGPIGEVMIIAFDEFGLELKLVKSTALDVTVVDLIFGLTPISNDVFVRQGVRFTEIIPLPGVTPFFVNEPPIFTNDPADPDYVLSEYEWRTWAVPTQSQLSGDLLFPKNRWKAYVGDFTHSSVSPDVVEDMNSAQANMILKDGTVINRFNSYWTDWSQLNDVRIEKISDGYVASSYLKSEFIEDTDEPIDLNRLQVFVNGIQLNPNTSFGYFIEFDFSENQERVKLVNTQPEGSTILLIYLKKQPSSAELAFDPDIEDDFEIQKQFKSDYQYTIVELRDEFGNATQNRYYFWVEDKSTPAKGKRLPIEQVTSLLENEPSAFMMFSRLVNDSLNSASYDSCAIVGLGRYVTQNDTYKIRFLRDFTLRDDPEQLNLKNRHTEWTLIRKGQRSKIPKTLWDKLTDAVSGTDFGGNPLPSQVRADYDERNGTQTRFGFGQGQIFADTELVKESIKTTILNTQVTIRAGTQTFIDYIIALNFDESDEWFKNAEAARATMDIIWNTARALQINEIFFAVLEDALADNYEFSDIFKTSFITVNSTTITEQFEEVEAEDAIF